MGVRLAGPSSPCLYSVSRIERQIVNHWVLICMRNTFTYKISLDEKWSLPLHGKLSHHLLCTVQHGALPPYSLFGAPSMTIIWIWQASLVSKLEVPSLVWTEAKNEEVAFHLWTPSPSRSRAGFVIFKIVFSMLQFVKASTYLSTQKFMVSQWSGDSLSGDRLPSTSLVIGW